MMYCIEMDRLYQIGSDRGQEMGYQAKEKWMYTVILTAGMLNYTYWLNVTNQHLHCIKNAHKHSVHLQLMAFGRAETANDQMW